MVVVKYSFIGSIATACNLAIDGFLFISSFLGFHKCFLIMDAKGETLSVSDILKLYARKFLRLAPSYYGIWFMEWSLTCRLANGKLWYRTNYLYKDCSDHFYETIFWYANLKVDNMTPWKTCY